MDKRINIKNRKRASDSNRGSDFSEIYNHWLFKLSSIVVSIIFITSVVTSLRIMVQKLEILKQAEQEVEELRLTNLHLSIEIEDMSTDRYLEKEARNRLNFGGEGEVAFVIPSNILNSAKDEVRSILNAMEKQSDKANNNMEEWITFLLLGV